MYGKCEFCKDGDIVDEKPSYIPIGADSVLKITDQVCNKCGAAFIGEHQHTKLIKNQKAHDELVRLMEGKLKI